MIALLCDVNTWDGRSDRYACINLRVEDTVRQYNQWLHFSARALLLLGIDKSKHSRNELLAPIRESLVDSLRLALPV